MKIISLFLLIFIFSGCGGGASSSSSFSSTSNQLSQEKSKQESASKNQEALDNPPVSTDEMQKSESNTKKSVEDNEFTQSSYRGLEFYPKRVPSSAFRLEQLSDAEFNALSRKQKLQVANNLLNTLFFGYPLKELEEKINSGSFLSDVRAALEEDQIDRAFVESRILDGAYFKQYSKKQTWAKPQILHILTRFYVMDKLDRYYFENWIAYILTQTIMFSPAYELSTTHTADMENIYTRLVTMLDTGSGARYITYVHMQSQENWRRFRSPEDNGREMLEIFTLDDNDSHVPLAAKALQNWGLNSDSDTLEVGLNKNTTPIALFGTTIYTGEDFYRELVKSDAFIKGVSRRLVDFFFPQKSEAKKQEIVQKIVASKVETWQDILEEILFSKEYLLYNSRALSAEERAYSFMKKTKFQVGLRAFYSFRVALENMHQATMEYKLGRVIRVPLDTLSFAYYHKYVRESLFLNYQDLMESIDKNSWKYDGWGRNFLAWENFDYDSSDDVKSLRSFINYLFEAIIGRGVQDDEFALFKAHMIEQKDGKELLKDEFNIFKTYSDKDKELKEQFSKKKNIAYAVLDYLSRLEESYKINKVQ